MKIISSDCLGALIYKEIMNKQYDHPFVNNIFNGKDFIYFMKNMHQINFENFQDFTINTENFNRTIPFDKTYGLNIDNKIKVLYPHSNDLKSIVKNYTERLKRFSVKDTDICFILDERVFKTDFNSNYTEKDMVNFCQSDVPYKKILCCTNPKMLDFSNSNTQIFIKDKIYLDKHTRELSKIIFQKYHFYFNNK